MRSRLLLPLLVVVLLAALLTRDDCAPGSTVVERWAAVTAEAVEGQPDVAASRTWALAWTAAERSLGRGSTGDTVAGSVGGVLQQLVPGQEALLQRAFEEGCHRQVGAGLAVAQAVVREREDDGLLDADVPLPASTAPGRWRPTPPALAPGGGAGLARATPFALPAPDAVRPPPPAPLGSAAYRRDLDEVRRLGALDSAERTAEQTATALFWAPSSVALYTEVLREVLPGLRTREGVRLLAAFHRTAVDVQVAVGAAKARDPRWRPVTALRDDGDGDPRTPRVPGWTPLVDTPPNPEHPSGHTAYAAAAAEVLQALVGPRAVTVRGRTWTDWQQLVQENEDARVWAGLHLRSSDEAGSALGRAVADYARPAWDAS